MNETKHTTEEISLAVAVIDELREAESLHLPLNSAHEAYAVIREELEEFWEEVKKKASHRDKANMRKELIQTAAMCLRTIKNLGL